MRALSAVAVVLCASVSAHAEDLEACRDPGFVSFTVRTPYTAEVADVVPWVWLPNLLVPCPFVGFAIGQSRIPLPLADGTAQNVTLLHSVGLALCAVPLAFSIVGAPLVLAESCYVAPVSILNALDRDVRCAKARGAHPPPPSLAPSPPPPARSEPPARRERPERPDPAGPVGAPPPPPRREDPLPPPPEPLPAPAPAPPQAMRY